MVRLKVSISTDKFKDKEAYVETLTDIKSPAGIVRTYTIVKHSLAGIGDNRTFYSVECTIEVPNIVMVWYGFMHNRINEYLNNLCVHTEQAASMIYNESSGLDKMLNEEQLARISEYRKMLEENEKAEAKQIATIRLEKEAEEAEKCPLRSVFTLASTDEATIVSLEAVMPDEHIHSATEAVSQDKENRLSLFDKASILAQINNPLFATRGSSALEGIDKEFRQEAYEFGYDLYNTYCKGRIREIMPLVLSHGKSAVLALKLNGPEEALPWEAMHDGSDFLSMKLQFSRVASVADDLDEKYNIHSKSGVLLIGANARGDLPGVDSETQTIASILEERGMSSIEVLNEGKADRTAIVKALKSGHFRVLHFSGHSVFNSEHPFQSYLELSGNTKLYLYELSDLTGARAASSRLELVFMNSCQSAKVGVDPVSGKQLSLCRFLRESGVSCVVGMLWNIGDDAATQFGAEFYTSLLSSGEIDPLEAMRMTRKSVATQRAWKDGSWLAPVLYS